MSKNEESMSKAETRSRIKNAANKTLSVTTSAPVLGVGGAVGGGLLTESILGPVVGGVLGALLPEGLRQGRKLVGRLLVKKEVKPE